MKRIEWQAKRAEMAARKVFGKLIDKLMIFFSSPPPELDESHAEVRYTMAQMSRKEWDEYKKAMEAKE